MKLAYWMYAGPAHIGVLRVSSSFKNVHAIMHAPLGDDYFNVMRSMLERERDFTPVTASIVDRHVLARGSQEKVVENITRKNKEETPDLIILTPTCTSSILQEDLHNFVERVSCDVKTKHHNNQLTSSQSLSDTLESIPNGNESSTNNSNISLVNTPKLNEIQQINQPDSAKQNLMRKHHELHSVKYNTSQPDVILADVNHYRVNELQAADRTLEQIVRFYIEKAKKQNFLNTIKTEKPSVNIIGIFTLGFHNQHDCRELKRLFNDLGIKINEIIPEGGDVNKLKNLPQAWFNFVPYREVGLMTAIYLKSEFNMPYVSITPMGLIDTAACIRAICNIIIAQTSGNIITYPQQNSPLLSKHLNQQNESFTKIPTLKSQVEASSTVMETSTKNINKEVFQKANFIKKGDIASKTFSTNITKLDQANSKNYNLHQINGTKTEKSIEFLFNKYIDQQTRFVSQSAWFSRSIDCQNLTGKKVVVFGDATHSAAMTKILSREMGIRVSCAGTYCKHDADWFREQVNGFCDQILITDDHTQVGQTIEKLEPAAIFGTQMERHVGKRLDIPCGVISAPVHIQNFPLGYRPFLGYEGTNQIADLVYNSFNLGMEDHLLQIFGGHDSVLNDYTTTNKAAIPNNVNSSQLSLPNKNEIWSPEGLIELNKVPGFVRGKVKRNTEKYALQNNIPLITVEVMYAAKEALSTN
uniref:Light-independent protochlorophyllide reductase subunit B n=1 Tax=Pandorina colemaniae TaxID=47786 RepID=A0A6C0RWM6_9CHLO|nr:protochlorophyllide reductase subunit B [Pandorina colemaniae]